LGGVRPRFPDFATVPARVTPFGPDNAPAGLGDATDQWAAVQIVLAGLSPRTLRATRAANWAVDKASGLIVDTLELGSLHGQRR